MPYGFSIHTSTTVECVSLEDNETTVGCNEGLALETDALLVAVGRRPVVDGLGLPVAGVNHDANGIPLDWRLI